MEPETVHMKFSKKQYRKQKKYQSIRFFWLIHNNTTAILDLFFNFFFIDVVCGRRLWRKKKLNKIETYKLHLKQIHYKYGFNFLYFKNILDDDIFIHFFNKNSLIFSFSNHIIPQTRYDFWVKLRHEKIVRMRKIALPMRMKTDYLLILFYMIPSLLFFFQFK